MQTRKYALNTSNTQQAASRATNEQNITRAKPRQHTTKSCTGKTTNHGIVLINDLVTQVLVVYEIGLDSILKQWRETETQQKQSDRNIIKTIQYKGVNLVGRIYVLVGHQSPQLFSSTSWAFTLAAKKTNTKSAWLRAASNPNAQTPGCATVEQNINQLSNCNCGNETQQRHST